MTSCSLVFRNSIYQAGVFGMMGTIVLPEPMFDSTESRCLNAVVDVLYNFTWSGSQITSLEATIVLGTVSSLHKICTR